MGTLHVRGSLRGCLWACLCIFSGRMILEWTGGLSLCHQWASMSAPLSSRQLRNHVFWGFADERRFPIALPALLVSVVLTLFIFTLHYDPHSHAIKPVRHQKNKDKLLMRWKGAALHAESTYSEGYVWINCSYFVHPHPPTIFGPPAET